MVVVQRNKIPKTVPGLLEMLRKQDEVYAGEAAEALGALGLEPEVVVPALVQALHAPGQRLRNKAASALGDFGARARSAIPALIECFQDPAPEVRYNAAVSLSCIGSEGRTALLEALSAKDPKTRAATARTMRFVLGQVENLQRVRRRTD